ncbi:hypothetical protein EVAR_98167_1 [Eumeta japonica]|uniref:Uncharacterized protein n=1 Tax=Eumeta variegata TaxID=151549 RepID=A0A4C1YEI3_EUMVA|nr:hypothetical protein EVAR_98167_1 [Eumeta japonica]
MDADVKLVEKNFGAWKKKRNAIGLFCDLSRAFDCALASLPAPKVQPASEIAGDGGCEQSAARVVARGHLIWRHARPRRPNCNSPMWLRLNSAAREDNDSPADLFEWSSVIDCKKKFLFYSPTEDAIGPSKLKSEARSKFHTFGLSASPRSPQRLSSWKLVGGQLSQRAPAAAADLARTSVPTPRHAGDAREQ